MAEEELLTVKDVAALLKKSEGAVYNMLHRGQIAGVLKLGRRTLIKKRVFYKSLGL